MAKVVKTVRIEESLIEKLNEVADVEFGGNATAALEAFISQAIAVRTIPECVRWGIYSKSKEQMLSDMDIERGSRAEHVAINNLTTALWL